MWFRILILALGTFAIGTDGFVIAGVLDDIAAQAGVEVSQAGQLITVFAWVLAVSSPVLAAALGRFPRRGVLLWGLGIFTLGNLLIALSSDYEVLVAGRAVAAIGAAMFVPNAAVAATAVAPEEARGRALAVVGGGITVATVFGSPLGTYLGSYTSYQGVFWMLTGVGVVALIGVAVFLPTLPNPPATSLRTRLSVLKVRGVGGTLLTTLLAFLGGFTVYTYIKLLLEEILEVDAGTLTLLLVVYGIGGACGNFAAGWLVDKWGSTKTTVMCVLGFAVMLGILPWTGTTVAGAAVTLLLFAGFAWMILLSQQHRLIGLAPKAPPLVISLNTSAQYIGIGASGLVGGAVIDMGDVRNIGPTGAVLALVSLVVYLISVARSRATETNQAASETAAPPAQRPAAQRPAAQHAD
ncbi:MFS transporter [Streptomyces sp. NPDC002889]|uniref:MFS transporter n=1 Tax=Streptomyces sp. NPDC002889 TaxID=3364669 RepID=UPI003688C5CA